MHTPVWSLLSRLRLQTFDPNPAGGQRIPGLGTASRALHRCHGHRSGAIGSVSYDSAHKYGWGKQEVGRSSERVGKERLKWCSCSMAPVKWAGAVRNACNNSPDGGTILRRSSPYGLVLWGTWTNREAVARKWLPAYPERSFFFIFFL